MVLVLTKEDDDCDQSYMLAGFTNFSGVAPWLYRAM